MPEPLTANQKAFLAESVRVDGERALKQLYRDCKCEGWEAKSDVGVTRRMHRLLARPDAQLLISREKQRHELALRKKLSEQDGAVCDAETALARLREDVVRITALGLSLEYEALKDAKEQGKEGKQRSAAGLAKLLEVALKLADRPGGEGEIASTAEAERLVAMVVEQTGAATEAPPPEQEEPEEEQAAEGGQPAIIRMREGPGGLYVEESKA